MTETLTENEREILTSVQARVGRANAGSKALRIIDALTARAEAAERAAGTWQSTADMARNRARRAESESAALRADLGEAREVAERNASDCAHLRQSAVQLESEAAALRAEVERMKLQMSKNNIEALGDGLALEHQLAAANALLDEWLTVDAAASSTPQRLLDRVHAHLASQPAELPCVSGYVGSDGQCSDCGKHHAAPTRTEAEQRVLEVIGDVGESLLREWADFRRNKSGHLSRVAAAELARRGLK